jgi:hypothetical protein
VSLSTASSMNVNGVSISIAPQYGRAGCTPFLNAGMSDCTASSQTVTGMNRCRCRNQTSTGIKGPSPVPECSGTGLRYRISECRCRSHRPRCRCPAMLYSNPEICCSKQWRYTNLAPPTVQYLPANLATHLLSPLKIILTKTTCPILLFSAQ